MVAEGKKPETSKSDGALAKKNDDKQLSSIKSVEGTKKTLKTNILPSNKMSDNKAKPTRVLSSPKKDKERSSPTKPRIIDHRTSNQKLKYRNQPFHHRQMQHPFRQSALTTYRPRIPNHQQGYEGKFRQNFDRDLERIREKERREKIETELIRAEKLKYAKEKEKLELELERERVNLLRIERANLAAQQQQLAASIMLPPTQLPPQPAPVSGHRSSYNNISGSKRISSSDHSSGSKRSKYESRKSPPKQRTSSSRDHFHFRTGGSSNAARRSRSSSPNHGKRGYVSSRYISSFTQQA